VSEPTPSVITPEQVEHVARLARLELAAGEMEELAGQLAGILGHVAALSALDLEGVERSAHPLELVNVVRADEVGPTLERDEVLAAAPATRDGRFLVPRILDAP